MDIKSLNDRFRKTFSGGNDFELADALRKIDNTEVIQVESPIDVLKYLNI